MMRHIPNVLSREQVVLMRRRLAEADWLDGRGKVGTQGARRTLLLNLDRNLSRARGWAIAGRRSA